MPAEVWPQPVLDLLATGDDRPVFEDGDRRVTTAQMYRLVRRIAAGLRAAGAGPGVGVALRLGVTAEAFAAIIAAFAVGARVSGIRPDLTPAHRAWQLGENTLLVDDARVAEIVDRVTEICRTGRLGDGKIFVMPVQRFEQVIDIGAGT